jgi:hypothetical protein
MHSINVRTLCVVMACSRRCTTTKSAGSLGGKGFTQPRASENSGYAYGARKRTSTGVLCSFSPSSPLMVKLSLLAACLRLDCFDDGRLLLDGVELHTCAVRPSGRGWLCARQQRRKVTGRAIARRLVVGVAVSRKLKLVSACNFWVCVNRLYQLKGTDARRSTAPSGLGGFVGFSKRG